MNFHGFYGNEDLKTRLAGAFDRGMVSHSYLICGPEGSGKRTLARILAAAMQCTDPKAVPCGVCPACRKALGGQHPDVIRVDDEKHVSVAVDVIREMRTDVFIRPNEGRRKVYILERGQDLGPAGQNALLKILEEPPEYAAFLILSVSADKLLPTVRSRCAELHLSPVSQADGLPFLEKLYPDKPREECLQALQTAGGWLGQAAALLREEQIGPEAAAFAAAFAAKNDLALLRVLLPLEKSRREQLLPILQQMRGLLCRTMELRAGRGGSPECRAILKSRTGAEIFAAAEALRTAADHVTANVSVGAVIGWLTGVLR